VLGYLLTPKTRGPFAAVIAIPGHGRGVDDIVGIDEHGRDRTVKVAYEYDYAIQIVEHGMAAVAIEPMAFGCRRDAITKAKGLTASACQPAGGSALLLGQTILGWRVYDTMRTIDWIATRRNWMPRASAAWAAPAAALARCSPPRSIPGCAPPWSAHHSTPSRQHYERVALHR